MKLLKSMYILLFSGIIILSLVADVAITEEKSWTYGGVEYVLPKPVEQIQIPNDLPAYHEVVSGDCLWFITQRYLNDPFLWPLVWEENLTTIPNPHKIYPGQQVKLPGGGSLVSPGGNVPAVSTLPMSFNDSKSEKDEEDTDKTTTEEDTFDLSGLKPKQNAYTVTTETAIIASGYIFKDMPEGSIILGSDTESYDLSHLDLVFIDGGSDKGYEPEQDLFVIRKIHKVYHPITNQYMGWMVHIAGEVRTICVDEDLTTGVIQSAYEAILRGDLVIPKTEIPIPVTLGSPPTDICNPSTKQLPGTIVDAFYSNVDCSDAAILGRGDLGYIDLGSKDGVAPGDYFTIFKRNLQDPRLPRYVSGEAMVVKVAETTSTIVLTKSKTAVFIGDQIELKQ